MFGFPESRLCSKSSGQNHLRHCVCLADSCHPFLETYYLVLFSFITSVSGVTWKESTPHPVMKNNFPTLAELTSFYNHRTLHNVARPRSFSLLHTSPPPPHRSSDPSLRAFAHRPSLTHPPPQPQHPGLYVDMLQQLRRRLRERRPLVLRAGGLLRRKKGLWGACIGTNFGKHDHNGDVVAQTPSKNAIQTAATDKRSNTWPPSPTRPPSPPASPGSRRSASRSASPTGPSATRPTTAGSQRRSSRCGPTSATSRCALRARTCCLTRRVTSSLRERVAMAIFRSRSFCWRIRMRR